MSMPLWRQQPGTIYRGSSSRGLFFSLCPPLLLFLTLRYSKRIIWIHPIPRYVLPSINKPIAVIQLPATRTVTLAHWARRETTKAATNATRTNTARETSCSILSPNNPPKIQLSCQKSIYHPSTDILRLPQVELDYRHPKYHNFSSRSFFVDKLEKSPFSNQRHYPNILYKHTKKKSLSVYYQSSLS